MPLYHSICTLQHVLLLLLILYDLQPPLSRLVSNASGPAYQLELTSTKSLVSIELCHFASTIWPKAVMMTLMSIVIILVQLLSLICDIPAARHNSFLNF